MQTAGMAATGPCHQTHLTWVKSTASVRAMPACQLLGTLRHTDNEIVNMWTRLGPDNANNISRQLYSSRHLR